MSTSLHITRTPYATGSNKSVMPTSTKDPDALGTKMITVALIGPDELWRNVIADALAKMQGSATTEFPSYPGLDDVPRLLDSAYDVIIIELDSNSEHALELVENICSKSTVTVMVYSEKVHPEMLVRCMRAGAREFLTAPISPNTIAEALVRASVRRPAVNQEKSVGGKQFVFVGAKGGAGVTTIATNFAVSLARESGQSTVLIDINVPLGDAALTLGINAKYSTVNALEQYERLDPNLFSTLLTVHSSGLSVLAAPDRYTQFQVTNEALEKLLSVARQTFQHVVVDAGSRIGSTAKALLESGPAVYLVTQVSVSDLRNANRLVSELLKASGAKVEVVLNRFTPRNLGIDEESLNKALTMPITWKVPGDYVAARSAQDTATPLCFGDSQISRVIRQMTKTACGASAVAEKKKRFSLFG